MSLARSHLDFTTSIPPRIWEQDHTTWKAWLATRNTSMLVKQQYKKAIADFYYLLNLPILEISEQDIQDYADELKREGKAESTVRRTMTPIRNYWKFAQQQSKEAQA